ncbi:MAG TPA: hypothetical protein VEW67_06915 [Thermoleophilaceae bacterium]|nr:hypothetical protein [Thermoleophilaceae bacterium]
MGSLGRAVLAGCLMVFVGLASSGAAPVEDHVFSTPASQIDSWISQQDPDDPNETAPVIPRPEGYEEAVGPAVAPDGQNVFFEATYRDAQQFAYGEIVSANTNGTDFHKVMPADYDDAYWRFMRFAPDGRQVLINRMDGETFEDDIYLLSRDSRWPHAPDVTPLIEWPGDQYDASFTPDGTRLVFTSNTGSGGTPLDDFGLFIADADGSNAQRLTAADDLVDIWWVRMSPAGDEVAFLGLAENESDYSVYTIDLDNTDLEEVADDAEELTWSVDGTRIYFNSTGSGWRSIEPDGTDEETFLAGGPYATVRQPSTIIGPEDIQAARFRPMLQFDTTETWRPLEIERFLAEYDPNSPSTAFHRICDTSGCDTDPIEGSSALQSMPSGGWIDIGSLGGSSPSNYHAPDAGCDDNGLRDCDGGDKSTSNFNKAAFYYHAVESPGTYTYIDYWTFYRYNDLSVDEHEGDWEGFTVVPSLVDGEAFEAVALAQHNTTIWYLPGSLECDAGGEDSCDEGKRPWVYVASGSHASYSSECENDLIAIPPQICLTPSSLPEADHDGDSSWGRNDDDPFSGALLEFPPATGWGFGGDQNWVDWPGHWGDTCAPDFDCVPVDPFPSPSSPGSQPRFQCPWDGRESCGPGLLRATGEQREQSASQCRNWFGSDILAVACSPTTLRRSLEHGHLGRRGGLVMSVKGSPRRGDTANGVSQLAGAPLLDGDRLTISGRSPADTEVLVRAQHDRRFYEVRFSTAIRGNIRVRPIRAGRGLRFEVRLPNGELLPPSAIEVRETKLPSTLLTSAVPRD